MDEATQETETYCADCDWRCEQGRNCPNAETRRAADRHALWWVIIGVAILWGAIAAAGVIAWTGFH